MSRPAEDQIRIGDLRFHFMDALSRGIRWSALIGSVMAEDIHYVLSRSCEPTAQLLPTETVGLWIERVYIDHTSVENPVTYRPLPPVELDETKVAEVFEQLRRMAVGTVEEALRAAVEESKAMGLPEEEATSLAKIHLRKIFGSIGALK